ncbi:DUF4376 domain-containing protein [Escherichia fergusonii]|uniref:DUF4376 domain-containing protein n=1 Tax=Escherichia fergusonii TaxID=564 RepID=UPI0015E9D366|nr:DUF4376 domain-containing protein [Escherichia fergusonii]QMB10764.1 DUF4376 domain-containing protein [Escherichia fergusonii]QMC64661.1 DUF4376 domain-containing protein [Escherichia fergusonii]
MYYYSPSVNSFYPSELKESYIALGSFPDDAVEVDDEVFVEFSTSEAPSGKVRVAGEDNLPCWADIIIKVEDVKAEIITKIKALRDLITADYIIIQDNHFHSDTSSRIQQMSLTKMGQAGQVPAGLMWQTKNNGLIPLTNEIAAKFELVTMDHDMRLFATAQRHIAAIEALEDIKEIQDYDYSTGWQP